MKEYEQMAVATIKALSAKKTQTRLMRRLILTLAVLSFSALPTHVAAQGPTPPTAPQPTEKTAQQQESRGSLLTPAMRKEYAELVKSNSGEAAVRAWARRHKLEIVSLKAYDIMVIPEQSPQDPPEQELFAGSCDPKKCDTASGISNVKNLKGQIVGFVVVKCTAGSCKWVKDANGKWQRRCGDWSCNSDGPIYPL